MKNSSLESNQLTDARYSTIENKKHHYMYREPFYCWECVTLVTEIRTIDFVIEDETCLFAFINYMQQLLSREQKRV